MIKTPQNISEVLTIFHDGWIQTARKENQNLTLTIYIPYLANLVHPTYNLFFLTLKNFRNASFSSWPRKEKDSAECINWLDALNAEPDILEGKYNAPFHSLLLNQDDENLDYCGGEIRFLADDLLILDESKQKIQFKALINISHQYWNKWEIDKR